MVAINPSGNQDIDGLLWGYAWNTTNLRYSFPTNAAAYTNNGYASVTGFVALNALQQASYTRIIDNINSFSGLHLTLDANPADITELRFANAQQINYGDGSGSHDPGNHTAEGNPPDPDHIPSYAMGDVWFFTGNHSYDNPPLGSFAYSAGLMHELGHALGLKHGFVTQEGHGIIFPALPFGHDSYEYSVMTYKQFVGDAPDIDNAPNHPTTYMQDDMAALQYMYGANFASHNENTTYRFDPATGAEFINGVMAQPAPNVIERYDHPFSTNYILMTVWDGGGNDTYDLTNYTTNISADLNPGQWINLGTQIADLGNGHFARANIANAQLYQNNPASLIENVFTGSGNDVLIGNSANNLLNGGAGIDVLNGGAGNDILIGGAGADQIEGGSGNNTADYEWSAVAVAINLLTGRGAGGDAEGDVLHNVQSLIGSAGADILIGDNAANGLWGAGGDDFIWGGGGADFLDGGTGLNTVLYDNSTGGVQVNLETHAGAVGDAQGDSLFNFQNVVGTNYFDVLTGDAGGNRLSGGGANDWLRGGGGADYLDGGVGENTAWYDTSAAGVQVNLAAGFGTGGDAQGDLLVQIQDVVGSAFGDVLTGNAGFNRLSGGGGNDWLIGGADADLLDGGAGQNAASYESSWAAVSIDLRVGLGVGGDAAGDGLTNIQDVVGSVFSDVLIGNGLANGFLAGAGDDTMWGGGGADYLDGGAGENTVSYDTSPGAILVSLAGGIGSASDAQGDRLVNIQDVIGSGFDDVLIGDAGANKLYGWAGNDFLWGGGGADLLDGGTGNNTAFYDTSGDAVQINLAAHIGTGGDAQGDILNNIQNVVGSRFGDWLLSDNGGNQLTGGLGADVMTGGAGPDTFIFHPGEANGDIIIDFAGGVAGDRLSFVGFGAGATFTQVDAAHWQVNYQGGVAHEMVAFSNAAAIHAGDFLFA